MTSDSPSNKPMHIAIVIEQFDPDAGGAERSTAQIASELTKRGHRVTIIAGSSPENLTLEGVNILAYSNSKSSAVQRLLLFRRWALQQLQQGDYDTSMSITMAVPAAVMQPRGGTIRETLERNIAMRPTAAKRLSKRLLLKTSAKQQTLLLLERKTIADPRVQKIVAVSGYVVRQLREHYDVPDDRIELIPNAAVMPRATDEQKQQWRTQVREGFQIPSDATVYLFAAQYPRLKGFDPLMRATRRLVDQGQNPVILLAGGFGYGQQEHVTRMKLRDHVRFIRQTRKMPALFAAADVTVLPSFYDPASKVVIESLMMGTPAISTSCNGASDFILPDTGQVRGRVVQDPADDAGLAQAMLELADPQERTRCSTATAGLADTLSMARHVDLLETTLRNAAACGLAQ